MQKTPLFLARGYLVLIPIVLLIAFVANEIRSCREVYHFARPAPEVQLSVKKHKSLFNFDPNLIDSLALDSLFLPQRLKSNILKYRAKGGHFSIKSDLRKLYGMNDSIFNALRGFVLLPEKRARKAYQQHSSALPLWKKNQPKQETNQALVDLNSASESQLYIKGLVGSKRALSIIQLREKLGGLYSVEQLNLVYSIHDSLIDTLRKYYYADSSKIEKRVLRECSWSDLMRFHFIDKYTAKHILEGIRISSEIKDAKDLHVNNIIDSITYSQLKYYLIEL